MRKHLPFICKGVLFFTLTLSLFAIANFILLPRYTRRNSNWPTTETIQDFYNLPKDSVDVLFLGSSHAVSAFSPQSLYDDYGITSYNLATEQQSMLTSYYLLEESLRTQKPQVVILDTMFLFNYKKSALNCNESALRKAFDYMKWSPIKKQAIHDICTLDPSQTEINYYLPFLYFHNRWTKLEPSDFTFQNTTNETSLKGFSALTNSSNKSYQPITLNTPSDILTEPHPQMKTYFEKIIVRCQEEGIELVLAKTPTTAWTNEMHNTVQAYADCYNLSFWDFNETTLFSQTSLDFATDYADGGHANIWGAIKLTNQIGTLLTQTYALESRQNDYWSVSATYYKQLQETCLLKRTTNLHDYLALLNTDTHVIFIAAKQEALAGLSPDISQQLKNLGITPPSAIYDFNINYAAIITPDDITESLSYQSNYLTGTLSEHQTLYSVKTAGNDFGDTVSICINNKEYAVLPWGLNLVVYDTATLTILDSVGFDVYGNGTLTR